MQAEQRFPSMLGNRTVSHLGLFVFKFLHRCNEIPWGWGPSLNMKCVHVLCIAYTHSLKVISRHILNHFVHETKSACAEPSEVRCGIFPCGVTSTLKKLQILVACGPWKVALGRLGLH